jgi:hypothetical protein
VGRACATETISAADVELTLVTIIVLVPVIANVAAAVILLDDDDVEVLVELLPMTATSVSVVLVV